MKRTFPRFFGFTQMDDIIIPKSIIENLDKKYNEQSKEWYHLLHPTNDIFMSFYSHYIRCIYYSTKPLYDFYEFGDIYGLDELIQIYTIQRIKYYKTHSHYILAENDKRTLMIDFPVTFNYMMNELFSSTNKYNIVDCATSIDILQSWFYVILDYKRISTMKFNIKRFISIVNAIIEMDHSELLCDIIVLIYKSSFFFIGNERLQLFKELLIDKWFYTLFAHWDHKVRQLFHHLLLYKLLFTRRSHLNWSKFDKYETELLKRQERYGTNMADIDRTISGAFEKKLKNIKNASEATSPEDIVDELKSKLLYCKVAYHEYMKSLKLYVDWDKTNVSDFPPICINFSQADLETLK